VLDGVPLVAVDAAGLGTVFDDVELPLLAELDEGLLDDPLFWTQAPLVRV
jgi:hypothetical protein